MLPRQWMKAVNYGGKINHGPLPAEIIKRRRFTSRRGGWWPTHSHTNTHTHTWWWSLIYRWTRSTRWHRRHIFYWNFDDGFAKWMNRFWHSKNRNALAHLGESDAGRGHLTEEVVAFENCSEKIEINHLIAFEMKIKFKKYYYHFKKK